MKSRRLSVSFSREYQDVFDYLAKKPNMSHYVCEAVREKMQNGNPENLENLIEKIVEEKIKEQIVSNEENSQNQQTSKNNPMLETQRNLIDSLF